MKRGNELIELRKMTKKVQNELILDHVTIEMMHPSKIYSFFGEHTQANELLFNILFGLDTNFEGDYVLFGENTKNFTQEDWHQRRNLDIQYVYKDLKLIETMKVVDNLLVAGRFTEEEVDQQLAFFNLMTYKDSLVSELGIALQLKVAIARSLLLKPKILMLEEPTLGLENSTIDSLMKELNRLKNTGVTILIATKNMSLIEQSDFVYHYKNNKLVLIKSSTESSHFKFSVVQRSIRPKIPFFYTQKLLRAATLSLFFMLIPIIPALTLYLLSFAYSTQKQTEVFVHLMDTVSSDVIVLDSKNKVINLHTDELKEFQTGKNYNENRLFFSSEDLNSVKQLENVVDIGLSNSHYHSSQDMHQRELNLNIDVDQLKQDFSKHFKANNPEAYIYFQFENMKLSQDFIQDYNPDDIHLLAGNFLEDRSNQLLIPDILAGIIFPNTNYKDIIGKSVHLDTFTMDQFYATQKVGYIVNGIYEVDFKKYDDFIFPLYVAWNQKSVVEQNPDLEQYYAQIKMDIGKDDSLFSFEDKSYLDSFEKFKSSLGLGYSTMVIKVKNEQAIPKLSEQLHQLFPDLVQLSQYSIQKGDYLQNYRLTQIKTFWNYVIVALLFGVFVMIFNRKFFDAHKYELATQYSLGYRSREIVQIIIYEHIYIYLFCFVLSYGLAAYIYVVHFKNSIYLNEIRALFTPSIFFKNFILGGIACLVSILFNIQDVNDKSMKARLALVRE